MPTWNNLHISSGDHRELSDFSKVTLSGFQNWDFNSFELEVQHILYYLFLIQLKNYRIYFLSFFYNTKNPVIPFKT